MIHVKYVQTPVECLKCTLSFKNEIKEDSFLISLQPVADAAFFPVIKL